MNKWLQAKRGSAKAADILPHLGKQRGGASEATEGPPEGSLAASCLGVASRRELSFEEPTCLPGHLASASSARRAMMMMEKKEAEKALAKLASHREAELEAGHTSDSDSSDDSVGSPRTLRKRKGLAAKTNCLHLDPALCTELSNNFGRKALENEFEEHQKRKLFKTKRAALSPKKSPADEMIKAHRARSWRKAFHTQG
jgi:hypothetical protein